MISNCRQINGRYRHLLFSTFRIDQDKIGIGDHYSRAYRRVGQTNRQQSLRIESQLHIRRYSHQISEDGAAAETGATAGRSQSNVLISGESGTGKELIAQSIHNASDRRDQPFVALNCGTLSRELIQSELFGYDGGLSPSQKQWKSR